MRVAIDLTAAVPAYEQIRAQIAALVAAGALAPGTRLPSVRALARDLGIAVNTAARAYRELEASGIVTTGPRVGTVVAPDAGPHPARDSAARASVAALVAHLRSEGLSDAQIIELVYGETLTHP